MSATISIVINTKGGAGATSLCVEAALTIAKQRNIALVDADLAARRSVAVLTDQVRALDASRTSANIAATAKGRLTVVEMTPTIAGAFTIVPGEVETLASNLAEAADIVVLDAPQPYAAAIRAFVTRASRFVLVIEPSLLGLSNARLVQLEIERFGISKTNQVLLVNNRIPRQEASRSDIENVLGIKVALEIPNRSDKKFPRTIEMFAELLMTSGSGTIEPLRPSSQAPIGDRRWGRKPGEAPRTKEGTPVPVTPLTAAQPAKRDAFDQLKFEVAAELRRKIDFSDTSRAVDDAGKLADLRLQVADVVNEIIGTRTDTGSAEEIAKLRQEIIDEALGLGPLESLLQEADITEIMVNGPDNVFVERFGKIQKTKKRFTDDRQLRTIIERIIAPIGRRIDESQPMVDARLADGSRVNAIIAPLALDGATLTIRRFPERRMEAGDLVKIGAVTPEIVNFLRAAVEARLNIVVAGGTGSGKTTFLNVLSSFLPSSERIVTIEDAAELSLAQEHVVRLESRTANIQGAGEVRIRDLLKNSLRMRPDRIIVGECRGGEALDMLQAMNTGHDGSLTTIHANSTRDAISRIETMVLMAGFDLPVRAIREQIASAVDMVLHLSRMRDGTRKLSSVAEVVGLEGEVVTMQEIFRFDKQGVDKDNRVIGDFIFTGVQPMCLKKFTEYGVTYDVKELSNLGRPTAAW